MKKIVLLFIVIFNLFTVKVFAAECVSSDSIGDVGYDDWASFEDSDIDTVITESQSTTEFSDGGDGCTWKRVWSDCEINGNWSSDGSIKCVQTTNYIPMGDCSESESPSNGTTKESTIKIDLKKPFTDCDGAYANNNDKCVISIKIKGVGIKGNKSIVGLSNMSLKVIEDLDKITSARATNRDGEGGPNLALVLPEEEFTPEKKSNNLYIIKIDGIKSVAPFSKKDSKLKIELGGTEMELEGINYVFNKPYRGDVKVINEEGEETDLEVGPNQILAVYSKKKSTLKGVTCSPGISNLSESLSLSGESSINYEIQKKGTPKCGNPAKIDFTLNYTGSNNISEEMELELTVKPIISYKIEGRQVNYFLGADTKAKKSECSTAPLTTKKIVRAKKVDLGGGLSLLQGKADLTNNKRSKVNLPSYEYKNNIRSKAIKMSRGLKNQEIVKNIKYIEGEDFKSSDIIGDIKKYNTIIIKNGNFIIDEDLGDINNKFMIMVLKDDLDNDSLGNIYIKPNVSYIHAGLYADGTVRSVDDNGNIYTENNTERTNDLKKQLIIEGSIVSRNTIGGSILGTDRTYVLPGGKVVEDTEENYKKAFELDLNNLRTGNEGCNDINGDGDCKDEGENDSFVIIKYQPIFKELLEF